MLVSTFMPCHLRRWARCRAIRECGSGLGDIEQITLLRLLQQRICGSAVLARTGESPSSRRPPYRSGSSASDPGAINRGRPQSISMSSMRRGADSRHGRNGRGRRDHCGAHGQSADRAQNPVPPGSSPRPCSCAGACRKVRRSELPTEILEMGARSCRRAWTPPRQEFERGRDRLADAEIHMGCSTAASPAESRT